ncbi:MAG: alkaline phosphatase family protein [Phycisphaerae bacterium]|jgi:predicted AlkP superfamily pyrophosphatase or phosphodiesterase
MIEQLVFLSVPGLRPGDLHDPNLTPNLHALALAGGSAPLVPTFPCVTSPVQANMLTGVGPGEHGVIANGFYDPRRHAVDFWVGHHDVIERPTFFTRLAKERPGLKSAVWHAQNIKGADADFIVTPAPIHEPDGRTRLWCYSKPDGLYEQMLKDLGHFPLQHYWGPLAGIQSTQWIVEAALWLARRHAPNFHYVYIPHLDYAGQKFGPHSREALRALGELDTLIGDFVDRYDQVPGGQKAAWVLAGEYAMTPVSGALFPNRILRQAGLLRVNVEAGREYLDLAGSAAFAMVDHQFAHVFVRDGRVEEVADLFRDLEGMGDVIVGRERAAVGLDHPRSAPVILMSRPDRWFAYYWWTDDQMAPPFARMVDIHSKPGYDPVELFVKMPERSIPLDASLVKGSHGAAAVEPEQRTVILTTHAELLEGLPAPLRDVDVYTLLCRAFGM